MKLAVSLFALTVTVSMTLSFLACDTYYSPPYPSIDGLDQGVLHDPAAPIEIDFTKPIVPDSLKLEIVKYDADSAGDLPDERGDASVPLQPIYEHDTIDGIELGGNGVLSADAMHFVITPTARMPVGTKLALVVEPGLTSTHGEDTTVRHRILFGYDFTCSGGKGTALVPSDIYFMLLEVEEPVGSQIQLYGALDVDPQTGVFVGQFTNADRNPANVCPSPCSSTQVCQLNPSPLCVAPSQRAGSVDEYTDFIPNATPPTGYSFTVAGCIEDQGDGTAAFLSQPSNMVVESPAVTINGLVMTASFQRDSAGVLRASGSVTGDDVLLGTGSLGPGSGTVTARQIPDGQAPTGVPEPPPSVDQ